MIAEQSLDCGDPAPLWIPPENWMTPVFAVATSGVQYASNGKTKARRGTVIQEDICQFKLRKLS